MFPLVNGLYSAGCLGITALVSYFGRDWLQDHPLIYAAEVSAGVLASGAIALGGRRAYLGGESEDDDLGSLVNRTSN